MSRAAVVQLAGLLFYNPQGYGCSAHQFPKSCNFPQCPSTGVQEGSEKAAGMRGLLALLRLNPEAAFASFTSLCSCIASWPSPPTALQQDLASLLRSLREELQRRGQWDQALARLETETLSPRIRTRIQQYADPIAS
jgi:hypothetical protein